MGSRDCFVGLSQGNPECCVPMAQQWNRFGEHWHQGLVPSVAEVVVVVESPSLGYFHGVRVRETRPTVRLNVC